MVAMNDSVSLNRDRASTVQSSNPSTALPLDRQALPVRRLASTVDSKLFTPEELAVLPPDMLGRQKLKQQAKKAKKKRAANGRTEDELMLGFMGMGVEEPASELDEPASRPMTKNKAKGKKKASRPAQMEVDEEASKEADFALFLANVGGRFEGRVSGDADFPQADDDEEL